MNDINIFLDESLTVQKKAQEVFFKNKGGKIKAQKEYFSPIKVKTDADVVYILNPDESKLDIYDKEQAKLIRSIGKKRYYKDHIHEFIYKYFINGEIDEFFENPVFFFPNDFFITKEEIVVWDTRNYMVKCLNKKTYKLERFCFVDKDVYDIELRDENIIFNGENEKEIEKIDWFIVENIKDRLQHLLKSEKIEDLNSLQDEMLKTLGEDESKSGELYQKYKNNILKNYIYDGAFNETIYLELKRCFSVIRDCKDFCFNENDDEFLFIPSNNERKEKLYFYKKDGTILSVCDDKVMKKLLKTIFFKDSYFLLDIKENNIIKIGSDNNFEKVLNCLSVRGGEYRFITNDSNYLYSYDHGTKMVVKIDVEKDAIIEQVKIKVDEGRSVKFFIPGEKLFRIDVKRENNRMLRGSLVYEDECIYEGFNLNLPVYINDDLIMILSSLTSEVIFFSTTKREIIHKEIIHPSINNYVYSKEKKTIFAYNYHSGMMFEYKVNFDNLLKD